MTQFLQQTINGLSIGSIYALIALGYTMVYGIIKLINFAHGEIFMFGAYMGMLGITMLGLPFYAAFVLSMVLTAILGVVIERVAYKPLRNSSRIAALITAIGVSFLIQNLMLRIMGARIYAFPQVINNQVFVFFGLRVNLIQMIIFVVSILLMIGISRPKRFLINARKAATSALLRTKERDT